MCVCRTRFKKSFLQKNFFCGFPPDFKKFGGAKKVFGFSFLIIFEIIKKFPLDYLFYFAPPPPPPTFQIKGSESCKGMLLDN